MSELLSTHKWPQTITTRVHTPFLPLYKPYPILGGYSNDNQPRDNQAPYQPNYNQGGYYASNNPPQQSYPQQNDNAYSAQGYGQQGNYQNQRNSSCF
jgi:hypothetical protein